MMVLLAAIALSSFVFTATPTAKIDVASLKVLVREPFDLIRGLRALIRRHSESS